MPYFHRVNVLSVAAAIWLLVAGIAAAQPRQRIPLDREWQALRVSHEDITETPPTADAGWSVHAIEGLGLATEVGEVSQGWYRCRIDVPAAWSGSRAYLVVDNWRAARAACWINGQRVAPDYWTGFLRVEWPVGELLRPGVNQIVLAFWSMDWARVELVDEAVTTDSEAGQEFRFLVPEAKTIGATRYLVPTGYGQVDPTLTYAGPTGPVWLERRPATYIESVRTMAAIDPPALTVDAALVGEAAESLTVRCEVLDGQAIVGEAEGPAGAPCVVACPEAKLWRLDDPKLYAVKVTLLDGGREVDRYETRTGFRTIAVDGERLMLNGASIRPGGVAGMALSWGRCASFLMDGKSIPEAFWLADKAAARAALRFFKSQNVGMVRFGQAVYPQVWLDAADEEGMLVIYESALCNSNCSQGIELDAFWEHWHEHMLRLVGQHQNHPSVAIWSLGNEVGHGGRGKIAYPRMAATVEEVRRLDPTRPITCSGDGDVLGAAETINLHYPQCGPGGSAYPGQDFPRSAFWLTECEVWPGYYGVADQRLRGKPVLLGEWDTLFGHPAHTFACVYGDEAFVGAAPGTGPEWTFLKNQTIHGEVMRRFIEGYRYAGVVHPSPWITVDYGTRCFPQHNITSIAEGYRPEMVMLLPASECFFGGSKIKFTAVAFNDSRQAKEYTLACRLEVDEKTLDGGWGLWYGTPAPSFQVKPLGRLAPGDKGQVEFVFELPPVDSPVEVVANLVLNGDHATVHQRMYRWMAYPRSGRIEPAYQRRAVDVFDPAGKVAEFLEGRGVAVRKLAAASPLSDDAHVVVIGENRLAELPGGMAAALGELVGRGGTVICLQQDGGHDGLGLGLSSVGPRVINTHNFARADHHPILRDIGNDRLRLWGQSLAVSRAPLIKSDVPGLRYLVDAATAGMAGMNVFSLGELRCGPGRFLLCQMLIEANLDVAPGAERLLLNLVRYGLDEPAAARSVRILSKHAEEWSSRFVEGGVEPVAAGGEVVWCDDAAAVDDTLVDLVENGATLVLYGLDPAGVAAVNERFALAVNLRTPGNPKRWWFAKKTQRTDLLDGVSNQDLFYIANEQVVGAVFEKIDDIMTYPVDVGSQEGLAAACDPAGVCEMAIGRGRIVFCQLNCFATRHYRQSGQRIFRQLLHNLGLAPRAAQTAADESQRFAPIDLRGRVNMDFRGDASAAEGGAFDQGENDLREFPVDQRVFAGIEFEVIDPARNDGKGCLVLRSAHTPAMPAKVADVAVGRTMDSLAVLLASAWGPMAAGAEMGSIVLHYEDGTTAALPIRYREHVTDWWDAPEQLEAAKPAWVGANPVHSPVTVYTATWSNPQPEKTVAWLDVVSAETNCPLTIIAISAVWRAAQ